MPEFARIEKKPFGKMPDGTAINEYLLSAGKIRIAVIPYGGIVMRIEVPDRQGRMGNITLGFDRLEDYLTKSPYFGCITGRYANRIGGARFTLDGVEYRLPANNGPNTLHGGVNALDKQLWRVREIGGGERRRPGTDPSQPRRCRRLSRQSRCHGRL